MSANKAILRKTLMKNIVVEIYDEKGNIEPNKFADFLGVTKNELAGFIGKTSKTIQSRPHSPSTKKRFENIVSIISSLAMLIGSRKDALIWLKAPHPEYGGLSPLMMIAKGQTDVVWGIIKSAEHGDLA